MRGIITRRIATILVAATVPLVVMAAGASAATFTPSPERRLLSGRP
jgi:hypothetical protein